VRAVLVYLLALLAAVSAGVSATFPLQLASIHRSAWKGNSQEFAPKGCGWHYGAAGQASSEETPLLSIFPTKILLASDGSKDAELAAATAVDLAKSTGSELHLVSVFPDPAYVHPYYETHFPQAAERLRREARKGRQEVLDERVERIREAGAASRRHTSGREKRPRRSSLWQRSLRWAS
jgi:hypothetical protein